LKNGRFPETCGAKFRFAGFAALRAARAQVWCGGNPRCASAGYGLEAGFATATIFDKRPWQGLDFGPAQPGTDPGSRLTQSESIV